MTAPILEEMRMVIRIHNIEANTHKGFACCLSRHELGQLTSAEGCVLEKSLIEECIRFRDTITMGKFIGEINKFDDFGWKPCAVSNAQIRRQAR